MNTAPKSGVDKRRNPRHGRRITCELWIKGVRHTGIVKDISRGGLFVQTRATAPRGTELTLVIAAGEGHTEIRVAGRVARSDRIRAQLSVQSVAGMGIEVMQPGALGRLLGSLRMADGSSE